MPSNNGGNGGELFLTPRNIGIGLLCLIVMKQLGTVGSNAMVFVLIAGGISALFVPTEKFDARKEMKLVYKGDWVPNDDKKKEEEKNKSWFEKGIQSVVSSIQGEATVAFETKSIIERNFLAFKLVTLTLHNGEEYHWIGAFMKYHFAPGLILSILLPLEKLIYGDNNQINSSKNSTTRNNNTTNKNNTTNNATNNATNNTTNNATNSSFTGTGRKLGKE